MIMSAGNVLASAVFFKVGSQGPPGVFEGVPWSPQQKGEYFIFTQSMSNSDRMYDYFVHGFIHFL